MSQPYVKIELSTTEYSDRDRTNVRVFVGGDLLCEGTIGGEPEDNIECRDYAWIKVVLTKLATRLGAVVTITDRRSDGEG